MNTNREKYYRVFSGKYLSNRSYDQTFTGLGKSNNLVISEGFSVLTYRLMSKCTTTFLNVTL